MKIGVVAANFPVLSETFVANDVRGLEALGHEVTAISLGGPDPAADGNPNYAIKGHTLRVKGLSPPVWRKVQKLSARRRLKHKYADLFTQRYETRPPGLPDQLWNDRLTWDAAIDQIDDEKLDWLHVHFGMRQFLLGYHTSRVLGIPLSVTLHAHDIFVNPLVPLFPYLLEQCAFVVTVSEYNKEAILKLAPNYDPARVHVLAMGIDTEGFTPQPHDPAMPFRFASTGRLVEIKGFHVLIEAAGLLAQTRDDFIVRIVGEGVLHEQLDARIAELKLEKRVELLGRKDASFLHAWLPQQDAFVLPCVIAKDGNRDGMPLALREGMSCGLPAISTDLLGLHETVSRGTGTLVAPDDAAALAAAMASFIDMPLDQYHAASRAARAKAETEFSLEHEVTTLVKWMQAHLAKQNEANAVSAH